MLEVHVVLVNILGNGLDKPGSNLGEAVCILFSYQFFWEKHEFSSYEEGRICF